MLIFLFLYEQALYYNNTRFAFTYLWEIQPNDGKIVKTEFHKSLILSKASLTYAQSQMRIDDKSLNDELTMSEKNSQYI